MASLKINHVLEIDGPLNTLHIMNEIIENGEATIVESDGNIYDENNPPPPSMGVAIYNICLPNYANDTLHLFTKISQDIEVKITVNGSARYSTSNDDSFGTCQAIVNLILANAPS